MAERNVVASNAEQPFLKVQCPKHAPVVTGDHQWASTGASNPLATNFYASWSWRDGVLEARVDPLGFYNLFVYQKNDSIAVSPSLLRLVEQGCDPTLDQRAVAVFHRLGMLINDDTPLQYVKVLPPGGVLRWDGSGPAVVTGGYEIPKPQQISRDEAIEGITTYFEKAMTRALDACGSDFYVPLSGGRDSRHILLEALRQGREPTACVTFHHNGDKPNQDAQSAMALCERLGVRHDLLGHARPRLADSMRTLVSTGLCSDEHAQMMPLHDYFWERSGASFDGIAGDILTTPDPVADQYMQLSLKGKYREMAELLIGDHGSIISTTAWEKGAGPLYSPEWDEEVRDYLAHTMESFDEAQDPYQAFWLFNRTRREINFVPQFVMSGADMVFCPYLDLDFTNFCLSLPYALTKDRELNNDALARAYPEVADIPYEEGFVQPAIQRTSLATKLRSLRDTNRIVAALEGQSSVQLLKKFLFPPDKLNRTSGDVYELHAMCLNGLDADRASQILELSKLLEQTRPQRLISHQF